MIDWQDLRAQCPDGASLVLVRWSTESNPPGFRLRTINSTTRTVGVSDRIPGCCRRLAWGSNGVEYEAFTGESPSSRVRRTKPEQLDSARRRA